MKIVVLSDIHFSSVRREGIRGDLADVLMRRAVRRLNRFIRPDVVVVLGDVVDDGTGPAARSELGPIRAIVDEIEAPVLAVAGNHDGDPEVFYEVFDRPEPVEDIKGFRFVCFLDPDEPGWNARRTEEDLRRMREVRGGFDGPVVALQHVPIFPPGSGDCPYNHTNADAVLEAMREERIFLAVSGHHHDGMAVVHEGFMHFAVAPALCVAPFQFLEIETDGREVQACTHALKPEGAERLFDGHVHTPFAYCGEDMALERAVAVAEAMGLGGLAFVEHSGQLYFDSTCYWGGAFLEEGVETQAGRDRRMDAYFEAVAVAHGFPVRIGLETDCDFQHRPVLEDRDRRRAEILIGAVHHVPELMKEKPDPAKAQEEYMAALRDYLGSGLQVLAHPFRVFRRAKLEVPVELFGPVADLLRAHGVAAEINYHTNDPAADFMRCCIERGVRLALGSDAHNLCEVGEFEPHLQLLEACGCAGRLDGVLYYGPDGRPAG